MADPQETPSLRKITIEMNNVLMSSRPHLDDAARTKILAKLCGYVYVDEVHRFQCGRFHRWIAEGSDTLSVGGILVETRFLDTGVHFLFRTASAAKFIMRQVPMKDDTLFFQKMSTEDQLRLLDSV
jgi:hypothetical protein